MIVMCDYLRCLGYGCRGDRSPEGVLSLRLLSVSVLGPGGADDHPPPTGQYD